MEKLRLEQNGDIHDFTSLDEVVQYLKNNFRGERDLLGQNLDLEFYGTYCPEGYGDIGEQTLYIVEDTQYADEITRETFASYQSLLDRGYEVYTYEINDINEIIDCLDYHNFINYDLMTACTDNGYPDFWIAKR